MQAVLSLLIGASVLCVHAAWWIESDTWSTRHWCAAAAVGVACLAAWYSWAQSPAGNLCWDGQSWAWAGPTAAVPTGVPAVAMDLQAAMLIVFRPLGHGHCWIWVVRADDSVHWQALRRALFSHGAAASPDALSAGLAPLPSVARFRP